MNTRTIPTLLATLALPATLLSGCQSANTNNAPTGTTLSTAAVPQKETEMPGVKAMQIGEGAIKLTRDSKSDVKWFQNTRSPVLTGDVMILRPGESFTLTDGKKPAVTYRLQYVHGNKVTFEQTTTERPINGPVKRSVKTVQIASFW